MATYSERIKELRTQQHWSQQDLADRLDLSKQTISQYERGVRKPDQDNLIALCDIFNVSTDYLLGKTDVTVRYLNSVQLQKLSAGSVRIPVLGRVAAGIPIDAIQDILDWEEIPSKLGRTGEFFALKIQGHSMEPRIADGDVVIVHCQPDADSGDVVIVQVNVDHATCKKLIKHESGISLISFNPAYDPINFTNDQIESLPVTIIGRVIENRQKY